MDFTGKQRIEDSSLGDIFSKHEGVHLMMSVTQSKSFGSPLAPAELYGQNLMLSLSGSSDSMGLDIRDSFDMHETKENGGIHQKLKEEPSGSESPPALDSNMSVTSVGTKDSTSTSSLTQDTNGTRPAYPYPHGYGQPPPYGRPHYPPPYQHPYYGGHYGGPPPPHPYPGSQGAPPGYHPYYRGYPPHSGYPPHPSYMHPQSSSVHQPINQIDSSTSSVTSAGSKKRTIDDVNDENAEFTIHRGDSNNSVCSSGTISTAQNPISKLICESPIKKDCVDPPVRALERRNSEESTGSSITFGELSMHSRGQGKRKRPAVKAHENIFNAKSLIPSPINIDVVDNGVTPISKNTRQNESNGFFFEGDNHLVNQTTSTPFGAIGISASKSSSDEHDSSSTLSLDIKTQISWNLTGDNNGETPVSFGGRISPGFWGDDDKSPSAQMFASMASPASLTDGLLGGANSPIPIFFNGPPSIKSGKKIEPVPVDTVDRDVIEMPSTPMPLQSPYMRGPHTSHAGGMYEHSDDMYAQMNGGGRHDGQHPCYQTPRQYHPAERIVNLRGQVPPNGASHPAHDMHLPPHIPSHHHFLASPIGASRNMMMMSSPQTMASSPYPHQASPHHMNNTSKRRCVPIKQPLPSKFQGDMEKYKNAPIPEFTALVNYPAHMSQKQAVNLPEGMRCCVMCGQACRCSSAKSKKGSKGGDLDHKGASGQYAMIPTQNKGLCTQCDVNVWIVSSNGNLEIKWCKGCKNFRPWASFGDKGLATKCVRCRERQREKYAAQKEEKDKKKAAKKMK